MSNIAFIEDEIEELTHLVRNEKPFSKNDINPKYKYLSFGVITEYLEKRDYGGIIFVATGIINKNIYIYIIKWYHI